MRHLLASACAVAALSLAAPAAAQSNILGDAIGGLFGGSSRIGNYDERIRIAYQRGEISEAEARQLRQRYYDLRERESRYREDGLSRDERYDLQQRLREFERRFQMARYDGRDRWDDADRWDDDDDWRDNNGRRCPPGLARKRNGCMPPGQVGRDDGRYRDSNGYREGYDYADGDRYVWQRDRYGRTVQIDRRTGRVVRVRN